MDTEQTKQIIQSMADGLANPIRTPILKRPDEFGLEYEDIFFPAIDGTNLEGWFIPADSNELVICNHFGPANRQGYPANFGPGRVTGNIEVNFLPKYKALHDAGYNVIAYDLRNHGLSASAAGGLCGYGVLEWRDVIGSLRFARSNTRTRNMSIHLQSLCLGLNSTMVAMKHAPSEFEDIHSLVAIQPVVGHSLIELSCSAMGIENGLEQFDNVFKAMTGFKVSDYNMLDYAQYITVPTLLVQVRKDPITRQADIQRIFDDMPTRVKELYWIEETTVRYDGYNYFGENPEPMIEWHRSQAPLN